MDYVLKVLKLYATETYSFRSAESRHFLNELMTSSGFSLIAKISSGTN